jgi:hypothetical protein
MESFSTKVKNELCRAPAVPVCCAQSECYGVLLLGNIFSAGELRVLTSHARMAGRLPGLFEAAFGFRPEPSPTPGSGKKYVFSITRADWIQKVRQAYGYGPADETVLHINNAVLEHQCCQSAFWRGAFCAGGTVREPEKKYRLEIVTPHRVLARELSALMRESDLEPSLGERSGSQVLALKASGSIEDFLALMGAPIAAMAVMQAKVEKEIRNSVNRRVNCDTANLDKQVAAAERLKGVIARLESAGRMEMLPDILKDTARARILHAEDSLQQLAERLGISKSCLNHRLRKLSELNKTT